MLPEMNLSASWTSRGEAQVRVVNAFINNADWVQSYIWLPATSSVHLFAPITFPWCLYIKMVCFPCFYRWIWFRFGTYHKTISLLVSSFLLASNLYRHARFLPELFSALPHADQRCCKIFSRSRCCQYSNLSWTDVDGEACLLIALREPTIRFGRPLNVT